MDNNGFRALLLKTFAYMVGAFHDPALGNAAESAMEFAIDRRSGKKNHSPAANGCAQGMSGGNSYDPPPPYYTKEQLQGIAKNDKADLNERRWALNQLHNSHDGKKEGKANAAREAREAYKGVLESDKLTAEEKGNLIASAPGTDKQKEKDFTKVIASISNDSRLNDKEKASKINDVRKGMENYNRHTKNNEHKNKNIAAFEKASEKYAKKAPKNKEPKSKGAQNRQSTSKADTALQVMQSAKLMMKTVGALSKIAKASSGHGSKTATPASTIQPDQRKAAHGR